MMLVTSVVTDATSNFPKFASTSPLLSFHSHNPVPLIDDAVFDFEDCLPTEHVTVDS